VRLAFPIPATQKRAGGLLPSMTLRLAVARSETAKNQWSIACKCETFRKGALCSTTFFLQFPGKGFWGEHHGRYLLLFTTLAFIPFLRS
jgi:hypothetical protein